MDPVSLRVTQNAYFSLLTHSKQLLLVAYCDPTAEITKWDGKDGTTDGRTDTRTDGQTNVEVEIVI